MLSETCARREFRAVRRRPVSPVRASHARSGALVHITGTAEEILFGSGLSLVGGPNDRCGTQHQSLRNDVSAPIVARGSSPTRTPSAFPRGPAWVQSSVSRLLGATSRALTLTSVRERAERSSASSCCHGGTARPTRGHGCRANQQRASERSRPGRRGVSSEGAAGASAAARRSGAASRKATLQARAPDEDIPRRPRAMGHRKARCRTRTDLTSAYRAIG